MPATLDGPILPTHKCFDDALDFLEYVANRELKKTNGSCVKVRDTLRRYVLVHGIYVPAGEPVAHAWVEEVDGSLWQGGILNGEHLYFAVPREHFYTSTNVLECTRYSVSEARDWNYRTGHFGPWEEKYRALCRARGGP